MLNKIQYEYSVFLFSKKVEIYIIETDRLLLLTHRGLVSECLEIYFLLR